MLIAKGRQSPESRKKCWELLLSLKEATTTTKSTEQERIENAGNMTLLTPFLIYNQLPMSCTQLSLALKQLPVF